MENHTMTNSQLNSSEFTLQEIIVLKNIARQATEIRPIRQGRIIVPLLSFFCGFPILIISIAIFVFIISISHELTNKEIYSFIGASIFLFLLSLIALFKGFRNFLGKGKPIITLTPEGFIIPKGNRFIPWNLVISYNMTMISLLSQIIEFKVAKSLEDKEQVLAHKPKVKGAPKKKPTYKVAVAGLGYEGLTTDKMMQLIETYMAADAARTVLNDLNVAYN
ncbi:hypothetical protein N5853_02360 [Bartonella sp. HY329]|uniref:hypothetical protein n=1 Tax=unclassified Bartonella TaxID=2645622 RepID=UPI0021C7F1E7|nr:MULTISPECIES: hypothetical protein [unclassified Bartonella]UXM95501.1 hypothetical protein N5853_02360 [Bartonella sp. HY329]UXN09826.1 hypothetical protein N5852_02370 [Bartonella sp. HY328]